MLSAKIRLIPFPLVLLVASAAAMAAEPSCSLTKIGTIPARITPQNQLLLDAKIGTVPVPLLLDTGAGWHGLTRPMGQKLGLQFLTPSNSSRDSVLAHRSVRTNLVDHTAPELALNDGTARPLGGKSVLTDKVTVSDVTLGAIRSGSIDFYALGQGGDGSDGQAAGVLGASNLRSADLEIDPAAGQVKLFDQNHCEGRTVYWSSNYEALPIHIDPRTQWLLVDVELDGQKLTGMIDTGASWTVIPTGAALDRFGLSPTSPGAIAAPEGMTIDAQPQEAVAFNFKSLRIGDITIHNPRILAASLRHDTDTATGSHMSVQSQIMPDILIGMNILKNFRLYIAYHEEKIYLTNVEAGRSATE